MHGELEPWRLTILVSGVLEARVDERLSIFHDCEK